MDNFFEDLLKGSEVPFDNFRPLHESVVENLEKRIAALEVEVAALKRPAVIYLSYEG